MNAVRVSAAEAADIGSDVHDGIDYARIPAMPCSNLQPTRNHFGVAGIVAVGAGVVITPIAGRPAAPGRKSGYDGSHTTSFGYSNAVPRMLAGDLPLVSASRIRGVIGIWGSNARQSSATRNLLIQQRGRFVAKLTHFATKRVIGMRAATK